MPWLVTISGFIAVHSDSSGHISCLTSELSAFCVNPPSTWKASLNVSSATILCIPLQQKLGAYLKKKKKKSLETRIKLAMAPKWLQNQDHVGRVNKDWPSKVRKGLHGTLSGYHGQGTCKTRGTTLKHKLYQTLPLVSGHVPKHNKLQTQKSIILCIHKNDKTDYATYHEIWLS